MAPRRKKPLSLKSAWIVRPAQKFVPKRQSGLRQSREREALNVSSCPISCTFNVGNTGACQRFVNWDGELVRNIPLQRYEDVKEIVGEDHEEVIRRPLITGIGAGTTYPDTKPAPVYCPISDERDRCGHSRYRGSVKLQWHQSESRYRSAYGQ